MQNAALTLQNMEETLNIKSKVKSFSYIMKVTHIQTHTAGANEMLICGNRYKNKEKT